MSVELCELANCQVYLVQVILAHRFSGTFACSLNCGQQQANQYGDE